MRTGSAARVLGACIVGLSLAACGSDDSGDGTSTATSPDDAMSEEMTSESPTPESDGGGSAAQGGATLTIGGETWEFTSFRCAFGHENTQSDVYSFSSDARGQHSTGANVQFQVDVRDDTGQGRYEGDGVVYEIHVTDISDFTNPAVKWESSNGALLGMADGKTVVTIDGDSVTATGLFDDGLTDDVESVEGTVEATCGAGSLR